MLNTNDTIMLNVVGTQGESRATKRVAERFDYQGRAVNEQGHTTGAPGLNLGGLGGTTAAVPDYPIAEFQRLQRAGDVAGIQALGLRYQRSLDAAGGGAGAGQAGFYKGIADACIAWLKQYHDFSDREGAGRQFVLKSENLEISPIKVNGATVYTVSGTAVFGR